MAKAAVKYTNESNNRKVKIDEVAALKKSIEACEGLIITHNLGLNAADITKLRKDLRTEGANYRIAKNTLVRRALEGTKFAGISNMFKGPVGMATSKDPLAVARATYNFAKGNEKLVILGGMSGDEALDLNKIKYLATLPSLDALRGKIVGLLQAPGAQLARLAQAYADKGGVSAPAPAAAAPAAAAPAPEAPAPEATAPAAPAGDAPTA